MKRLIIADIHSNNNRGLCTGHYFAVADMYLGLFANVRDVKVASGPIYKSHFSADQMVMLPYDMIAQGNYLINRIKALINAYKLFSICKDDIIVLQDGRTITNHLGILFFCRKKTDLYLIKYTKKGTESFVEKLLYRLIKNRIKGIICPNESVASAFDRKACILPDYIYTSSINKTPSVPFKNKQYDFCVVGRLNHDKGVVETAKFFRGKPFSVLIAGQAPADYSQQLKAICDGYGNIDLRLGYVSDSDYFRYISESRYCVLNYQGEYSNRSSGVVYDIIFSGVPVLGRRCKALELIEDNSLGVLYDSFDTLDLGTMTSENGYERMLMNIEDYLKNHRSYRAELIGFIES